MCGVRVFGHNKRREAKWAWVQSEPDLSKKKNVPNLAQMDSACRAPSAPDGLAGLKCTYNIDSWISKIIKMLWKNSTIVSVIIISCTLFIPSKHIFPQNNLHFRHNIMLSYGVCYVHMAVTLQFWNHSRTIAFRFWIHVCFEQISWVNWWLVRSRMNQH